MRPCARVARILCAAERVGLTMNRTSPQRSRNVLALALIGCVAVGQGSAVDAEEADILDMQGFTKFADPPALGVALDPVYMDPNGPPVERRWRAYANVVARVRSVDKFAATRSGQPQDGGLRVGTATPATSS